VETDDGIPVNPTTLASYAAKPLAGAFSRQFSGIGPYVLLEKAEIEALNASGFWRSFYARYPLAPGLFVLSRAGISEEGDEAIIWVMHIREGTWGHADSMLLRRQEGNWYVAGIKPLEQY
jgi:hypothetical protein